MAKGLPSSIIKQYGISKKAWEVFRSRKVNKRRTAKRNVVEVKKVAKRRRYTRKKRSRRRKKQPFPILPVLGLIPPAVNFINWTKDPLMAGNFEGALYNGAYSLLRDFTGYDLNQKKWTGGNMISTYTALAAGFVGHLLANKLGANRAMRKIPLIGKYIQL